MITNLFKKFLLLLVVFSSINVTAQTWQDTVLLLDKIINKYSADQPGAQVAISRKGEIIYSNVRGMADLEHNAPLTKQSKIEAGSVSKQFTAAAILLLEQQGKLSIRDDIRKYVNEVPDYGNTITIQHLLNHTSGLKDWGGIAAIAGWPRGTKTYSNDDALEIISKQKTLNNKPGDEYIYSNSNYNLLAIIVHRVSGMSLSAFSNKYLFEPAGMKNTEWRDNYRKVVYNRAIAYSKMGNDYYTNMPNENVYGNGGLLTTAEDLLIWNNYYLTGKLGTPSLSSKQIALTPLNNGKKNFYASGLFVDSINGWASIFHDGATAGYRAVLEHYPQLQLSIALLSNTSQPDMGNLPLAVRNLLVKNVTSTISPQKQDQSIDIKNFNPYLGAYRDARTGTGIKVFRNDTALYVDQNIKIRPVTNNVAMLGRGRLEFKDTKPRMLYYITSPRDTILYTAVDTANINDRNINDYTGNYYSDETESQLKLFIKDDKLMVQLRDNHVPLIPRYKDGFSSGLGDIYFWRDHKYNIKKLFISISRARKIEFNKIITNNTAKK